MVQWRTGGRAAGVLVALTTTVALAGCTGQPGAAAVVDGTAIPSSDVSTALTELMPYFEEVTTTNLLAVLVQEPTVVELAHEKGVGVSDEDAHDLLDQVVQQKVAGTTVTFSEPSLAVARYSIAFTKLQDLPEAEAIGEEIDTRLRALDLEINPRFGSLEDGNQIGAPVAVPWLASPEGAATAVPSDDVTPEPTPSAS